MAAAVLAIAHSAAAGQATPVSPRSDQYYDAQRGISLDDAIGLAMTREPALRAARADVDAARAERVQAGLRSNPSVSFEWRDEPAGTDNQTMIALQWPLDLFRRTGRTQVAEGELTAAQFTVLERERAIRADVRARYGDVLDGILRLSLVNELIGAVGRQRDVLRARVAEGAAPPLERDLIQVELQRLESERVLQTGRLESHLFSLRRSVGLEAGAPLTVRDTIEEIVQREALASPGFPASSADLKRADVQEAAARIAIAEAKVDRAEREGRIDVSLFGSYQRMDAGFPQFGISSDGNLERVRGLFHYVSAGAMVTIPLFNRNQGEVAAARAERIGATAAHEAARLSAQSEMAAAGALDQRAHEAVQLYGADTRRLARQNLDIVTQSYALGRVTVFEVLAEQRRFLEIEFAYSDALRAAFDARTSLLRALGGIQ
jgi:cobalt-zinc-cadmium efflux system outer membrane protein